AGGCVAIHLRKSRGGGTARPAGRGVDGTLARMAAGDAALSRPHCPSHSVEHGRSIRRRRRSRVEILNRKLLPLTCFAFRCRPAFRCVRSLAGALGLCLSSLSPTKDGFACAL